MRAASRQRPHARGHRGRGRGRAGADRVRRAEHRAGDQGAGGHHRRGAARRLQDQEVQAARRHQLRHVLLAARAGHGQQPRGHLDPARGRAGGHAHRRLPQAVRYGARPRGHAEPPRLPQHGGHGARGGRDVPHRREAPADRPRGGRRRDPCVRPGERGDRRRVPLLPLHGARHQGRAGGPEPRLAGRARGRRGRPLHQQHRGRDELHPVPAGPAAARVRLRQAGRRGRQGAHRGAPGGRRRAVHHARRRRPPARARHDRHRHARARRGAGRRHGRPRDRGHRGYHHGAAGGRRVRPRAHQPHEPQPGPDQRVVHALRARGGRQPGGPQRRHGRRAHRRGVGRHGVPRHGGRVAGEDRAYRPGVPRAALLRDDGRRDPARGGRRHPQPPGLRGVRCRRRRRAVRDGTDVPPGPGARDRPVRGSGAPLGHGPHPGHAAGRPRPLRHALAGRARVRRHPSHHVRERPQRDDDLLVRRAGRPRPPAHEPRGAGAAGGAHQPAERRPVRHAPEHRSRPHAQRRLQPEPRREERAALRDGRGVLCDARQEAAEGAPSPGRRHGGRHGRCRLEQRSGRVRLLRRQGRDRESRARAGAAEAALQGALGRRGSAPAARPRGRGAVGRHRAWLGGRAAPAGRGRLRRDGARRGVRA